jgi:hypothetical protein
MPLKFGSDVSVKSPCDDTLKRDISERYGVIGVDGPKELLLIAGVYGAELGAEG